MTNSTTGICVTDLDSETSRMILGAFDLKDEHCASHIFSSESAESEETAARACYAARNHLGERYDLNPVSAAKFFYEWFRDDLARLALWINADVET